MVAQITYRHTALKNKLLLENTPACPMDRCAQQAVTSNYVHFCPYLKKPKNNTTKNNKKLFMVGFFFVNNPGSPATCRHLYWRIPTGTHQLLNSRVLIFSHMKNSILNSFIKWSKSFQINLLRDNTLSVGTIFIIKSLTLS